MAIEADREYHIGTEFYFSVSCPGLEENIDSINEKNYFDAKDVISLMPDNMRVVYWDYYHTDEEFYDKMILKHKELTEKVVFAGGISIWYGFAPDEKLTYETTSAGLSSCRKNGIKDVYATCWGDDGCETDVMFTLPGLSLYGEYSYTNDVTNERVGYNRYKEISTVYIVK